MIELVLDIKEVDRLYIPPTLSFLNINDLTSTGGDVVSQLDLDLCLRREGFSDQHLPHLSGHLDSTTCSAGELPCAGNRTLTQTDVFKKSLYVPLCRINQML
jgi:hypothetical protein